jgi:hypothetical protein
VGCRKRDAQIPGSQQHHRHVGTAGIRKKLGMPGKRETGIVDNTLVQGCRDDSAEPTIDGSLHGIAQAVEQGACVRGVRMAAHRGSGAGKRNNQELIGIPRSFARGVGSHFADPDIDSGQSGAGVQYRRVGYDNKIRDAFLARKLQAELGTDAGRFACGQC